MALFLTRLSITTYYSRKGGTINERAPTVAFLGDYTMFNINDLRERRANLFNEAKTFLDTHRTENGTLSAEDGATYDRMEAEIIDLGDRKSVV